MTFNPGDTVVLKSGGLPMTIEYVSEDMVDCVWMDGKKIERSSFPAVALKPFNPPKGGVAFSMA